MAEIQRDPFWEVMAPQMARAGTPGLSGFLDPGTEAGSTGMSAPPAGLWERLQQLAQFAGNALPFRGGLAFGDPRLRAMLEAAAAKKTDQAGPQSVLRATALPTTGGSADALENLRTMLTTPDPLQVPQAMPFKQPLHRVEPGGWQRPGMSPRTLERLVSETPAQQDKDLAELMKLLTETNPRWGGPRTPPFGP